MTPTEWLETETGSDWLAYSTTLLTLFRSVRISGEVVVSVEQFTEAYAKRLAEHIAQSRDENGILRAFAFGLPVRFGAAEQIAIDTAHDLLSPFAEAAQQQHAWMDAEDAK